MTRQTTICLWLLATALVGCSSAPPQNDERDAALAAHQARAQSLAASAPPEGRPLAPWLKTERSRIEAERSAANQQFTDAEKACWTRFQVNACLRDARLARRDVTDRVRQEELAINEVERRRVTEERLRQLEKKQQSATEKAETAGTADQPAQPGPKTKAPQAAK